MHIVIISGSHRLKSQSSKVARYVAAQLATIDASVTTAIIDLAGNPLPLWDGLHGKPESASGKAWVPMAETLKKAEALVVVSPEWNGMVPAGLKNLFLFASAAELGHKPALIVTVSASRGGAYPVAELRESSYKNSRILYIPEHVIVQNAVNVLNEGEATSTDDAYIRRRMDYALRMLLPYGEALKIVRATGLTNSSEFTNGM
jgi:NAD(P)H-dependent FMN reductase